MFSPLLVFFLGLVIQKGATTAISIRQREIEMVCLSIKYNHDTFMWLNAYIAYLLWWMRDGKSAFIIGSMRNPAFFCDDEWVQMSRFRSDAYLNIRPQFLPEFLWSCCSWQNPPWSSRKKLAHENLWIFLKQIALLTKGFLIVYLSFRRATAR